MARKALLAVLPALLVLAGAALGQQPNPTQWKCRMDPAVGAEFCGLPMELANFQGYFECDNKVKIARPKSVSEIQALVQMFPRAKAVGMGASFNKEFFCAGNDTQSINIVMTEISNVLDFITKNPRPADFKGRTIPASFPIRVNEDDATVTVAAGVPQRMVLDWLADYRYWKQPSGWILPAQSWFIDQTIGGAVATGTHGSSMQHGSLSSQVASLQVVLGNGTLITVSTKINRHLWLAMGVSAGRLGIITELTMKIKPQMAVEKKTTRPSFSEWVAQIKQVQDAYKDAKAAGDVAGMKRALSQVDEMQTFWHVPLQNMWRADFEYLSKEPLAVNLNIDTSILTQDPRVMAMAGPMDSIFNQLEKAAVPSRPTLANNARYWANYYATLGQQYVVPGVYEASKAYLSMSEAGVRLTSAFAGYDQYEVAVPLEIAADCMAEIGAEIYGPKALWNGFRTPGLIRFVPGEEFYLSNTHGGPRMYVNLEDYLVRQTGKRNNEFLQVIGLFRERCDARLHWGKAGWAQLNEWNPCFDGAAEYPDTWCHFGCAVSQLDPTDKFRSESTAWVWNATRTGREVPLASCCGPDGFLADQCQCARRAACRK